jgi:Rieske Fe-S protein
VGESKIFTGINLAGRSVKLSLFRSASGVSAVDIYCTHAGCAVTPNGPELVCECHFSYFDAATGARKSGPAPTGLPTFTTSEIDGEIYVLTA